MKIKVSYQFYTDGDYTLRNTEEFGCVRGIKIKGYDRYADFIGGMVFEDCDSLVCKADAKSFLQKLLCDGIYVIHQLLSIRRFL